MKKIILDQQKNNLKNSIIIKNIYFTVNRAEYKKRCEAIKNLEVYNKTDDKLTEEMNKSNNNILI
jgi:hypothetical protein